MKSINYIYLWELKSMSGYFSHNGLVKVVVIQNMTEEILCTEIRVRDSLPHTAPARVGKLHTSARPSAKILLFLPRSSRFSIVK